MSKRTEPIATQETDSPVDSQTAPNVAMHSILTMRLVGLLDLMRRSGTLANKREFGLSNVEWRIMAQVGAHQPLSLNDLADLIGLDRGQLSRTVKAMVARGLLDRRRKPGGPGIVITLTPDGAGMHVRMIELASARSRFLTRDIDDSEIESALAVLDQIREHAEALLELEKSYGGI